MSSQKKIYFTAGPAKLPQEIMAQIHQELLNFRNTDISVLEMSHRSKDFENILKEAETGLRKLLKVPDNYSVLFMHGGAKTQFSMIPMNLCSEVDKSNVEYIVNGSWSKMAATEAEKYAKVSRHMLKSDKFDRTPTSAELSHHCNAIYRYYCDNETIEGVEFNYVPECGDPSCVLVSDMTSNFLSRPVDVSKFGIIFAGAQKNCGIAGLVIVVIRKDLLGKQMKLTPKTLTYQVVHDNESLFNTPLTFAIYVASLCFKWISDRGGLEMMDKLSKEKSSLLYDYIDNSGGFYFCPVEKVSRSRMNVVFLLKDTNLDSKFLEEAKSNNILDIKGHRTVGGFRASIYHGVTIDMVRRLLDFMDSFKRKHIP